MTDWPPELVEKAARRIHGLDPGDAEWIAPGVAAYWRGIVTEVLDAIADDIVLKRDYDELNQVAANTAVRLASEIAAKRYWRETAEEAGEALERIISG